MCCVSVYLSLCKRLPHSDFNKNQEHKVTLLTQEAQKCFLQFFLGKTLNLAVLDSGCTMTLCK